MAHHRLRPALVHAAWRGLFVLAVACSCLGNRSAVAQTSVRVRTSVRVQTVRPSIVMETARGDSVVLGRLPVDTVLEFLQDGGRWIQVAAPAGVPWRRGWVLASDLRFLDPRPGAKPARSAEFLVRGFGQFGGTRFTAADSIRAIVDTSLGRSFGGGIQVVLRSGLFVQGSIDRFEKTGSRLIVSGRELYRVPIPNTVRITPMTATVGYRDARSDKAIGYVGAGAGWHQLDERSPALTDAVRSRHPGVHVLGGGEYRVARFLWLAGEVQWSAVPGALGEPGVGPVFGESDLGGTTFRVKVFVGR